MRRVYRYDTTMALFPKLSSLLYRKSEGRLIKHFTTCCGVNYKSDWSNDVSLSLSLLQKSNSSICINSINQNPFYDSNANLSSRNYYHSRIKPYKRCLSSIATAKQIIDKDTNQNGNSKNESHLKYLEQRTKDFLQVLSFPNIDNGNSKGNTITMMHFDEVMEGWSKTNSIHGAECAERLLIALENNYDHLQQLFKVNNHDREQSVSNSSLVPSLFSYNYVLQAYAQSQGGEPSALKAESIFLRMIDRYQKYKQNQKTFKLPLPEPSLSTFHHVMNAWAKSNVRQAGQKAEEIYTLLESMNINDNNNSRCPTSQSLSIVFDAWANSTHDDAINRVITTLHYVIDQDRQAMASEGKIVGLNKIVFHSVLLALANSKGNALDAALKAEEVMNLLQSLQDNSFYKDRDVKIDQVKDDPPIDCDLKANSRTWSLLIRCWTNVVNHFDEDGGEYAAQRAETLLHQMAELYKSGEDVKPNSYCFVSCIQAWSKCRSEKGATRAVEILENKERLFDETGDEDLKPNTYEYNVCLAALCNIANDSLLDDAKKLLSKMERLGTIDTTSFNTVLSAYIKSNDNERHLRVWELFEDMKRLKIDLDTITYNTLMDAIGQNRDPDSIDRVLYVLQSLIESNVDKVNMKSFTTVLNNIAKSELNEKAKVAKEVFKELLNLHQKTGKKSLCPDVTAFGAFLSCCANENGSPESKRIALKLALGTYENLCTHPEYGKPNEYIFGGLIKASIRLTQDNDEKFRLLENLFIKCRNDGNISITVINLCLKAFPENMKMKLLQDCIRNESSVAVPSDWCRNVLKQNRPKTIRSRR